MGIEVCSAMEELVQITSLPFMESVMGPIPLSLVGLICYSAFIRSGTHRMVLGMVLVIISPQLVSMMT